MVRTSATIVDDSVGQLARRSTELETLESHKEVPGAIIAVIGALYSVLLAFVVTSVWENSRTRPTWPSRKQR